MKKIFIYTFVIFGITYLFSPLFGIYHKIGDYNTGSRISALTIKEEIIYATQYPDFIKILDVTNPEQPTLIGSYQIPDAVIGYITISDTLAFVNTFSSGIQILNISNPANPQLVGCYDYYGTNDIIISDNYAYIAGNDWFYILDISDLLNPICVGQIYGELCDMVLFENMIYGVHASSPNNLRIIDVSDPTNPVLLSNFNLPIYSSAGIAFKDFKVFIAYSGRVWSIDVENPANPVMLDTLNISNHTSKIIIEENKAIVNNSSSGFVVINITNPSDMTIISFYDTPGGAGQIDTIEDIVFVADCFSGVQIIDISDPSIQNLYSRFYTSHEATSFDFKDDHLYISDNMSGLEIISVSEPYNPQLIVSVPINSIGISTSVDILDNVAYCCAGYPVCSVNFVDISDPINSFWIGEILISGFFGATGCVNNSNAFIGSDYGNLLIFDETVLISEYIASSEVYRLSANETSVFLVEGGNGIEFVDISNIYNPIYTGIYDTNGSAHNVAIQNNLMYVSDGEEGIQIIDIFDLQNPFFISSIKPYYNSNVWAEAVIIDNYLIFFDHEWNELFVYDIENPATPIFMNSFQWNSTMNEIIIRDNVLFSCDSYYGVSIIDFAGFLSSEENLINTANHSLSNYPNPFNPTTTISFSVPEKSNIELKVYNIKGQKIKSLLGDQLSSGEYSVVWDGKDDNNKSVSSGIYFYKLKAGEYSKTRKMLLLR